MGNTLLSTQTCDNLSLLRGNDLLDLLEVVENTTIDYRDKLYLPPKLTFGVEIEYENVNRSSVKDFINNNNLSRWSSGRDSSLKTGGEIRSPILKDDKRTWEELKKICTYLKDQNANTSRNAGGHIHVGAPVIGDNIKSWQIFLKLYMLYEHIFYRFFYGDKINGRPFIKKYAPPIAEELYSVLEEINGIESSQEIEDIVPGEKYYSINFGHLDFFNLNDNFENNTFELRCPNATSEEIIWQNNINTFARMLLSSNSRIINEDFLNYKLKGFKPDIESQILYDEIFLKEALEFTDLIYDCNLDKVYFLRQYIKSFEKGFPSSEAILAKRFIK